MPETEIVESTAPDFESDYYFGACAVCGRTQIFLRTARAIRETYRCTGCNASLREREQAQAILGCFGGLRDRTLADLALQPAFRRRHIYEPGTIGPFRPLLAELPFYRQSDFYSEQQRAAATEGIPHQSLEQLGYADATFDLVITSDILEHVRTPQRAFSEIARVLKPGGYHVCTVPLQDPLPEKSVVRIDTRGSQDRPLLPEHYHGDGKGGRSLVYTDFGADIVDMAAAAGFATALRRPHGASRIAGNAITVVSQRITASEPTAAEAV
jgi:SAM-dependent methyltransferase